MGCSAHRGQKKVLDSLELELTGGYELPLVGAGNQTPISARGQRTLTFQPSLQLVTFLQASFLVFEQTDLLS